MRIGLMVLLGLSLAGALAAQAPSRSRGGRAPSASPAPSRAPSSVGRSASPRVVVPRSSRSSGYGGRVAGGGGFGGGGFGPYFPPSLSGRVLLLGGGSLHHPVRAAGFCGSRLFDLGWTDLRGRFNFGYLGFGNTLADNFLFTGGCNLRLFSPGFYPLIVPIDRGFSSVGKVRLRPVSGAEGAAVSFTSLAAPDDAQKLYQKAAKKMADADPDFEEAEELLLDAVELHRDYAAAWTLLGHARLRRDDPRGARDAFEKAVDADPRYVGPYGPLTKMAVSDGRWKDAYRLSGEGLRMSPLDTELSFHRALAALWLEEFEEAARSAWSVVEAPDAAMFPEVEFLLGRAYAGQGRFEDAVVHYRRYLERGLDGRVRAMARQGLAQARRQTADADSASESDRDGYQPVLTPRSETP